MRSLRPGDFWYLIQEAEVNAQRLAATEGFESVASSYRGRAAAYQHVAMTQFGENWESTIPADEKAGMMMRLGFDEAGLAKLGLTKNPDGSWRDGL